MPDAFARLIRKLQDEGRVARSQFSARSLKEFRSLFDAGVLCQERSGGGLVVALKKPEALRSFYLSRYPSAGKVLTGSPRASAVGTFRNAKRIRRTNMEPVLLRAMCPAICTRESKDFDLLATTRLTGAACLILEPARFWSFSGKLAIVENLECFLHFEKMSIPADVALYAAGRLSDLALQWLASEDMSECKFIHCGDYDPVGLDEFLRLRNIVGERVALHIPANLSELFSKYGRAELLGDSTAVLKRLRQSPNQAIRRVVSILDDTGCGLEQEVLLLG
jgi:hypothetical protein